MPRHPRIYSPGDQLHIVSRFANRAFRIDGPEARERYLEILGRALANTDWKIPAYGLMSSHTHLGSIAGTMKLAPLLISVNSTFARWLNKRDGTSGSVVEERPTIVNVTRRPLHAIAYIHNNPVRAGLVERAGESNWTSHRAYLGLEPAPPWLAIEDGLARCGLTATDAGRLAFDREVDALRQEPRDTSLSEQTARRVRAAIRTGAQSSVLEVGTPSVGPGGEAEWPAMVRLLTPRRREGVSLEKLIAAIAADWGVADWRSRTGRTARAKELLLYVACIHLGFDAPDVYLRIGMSKSRASELLTMLRSAPPSSSHVELALRSLSDGAAAMAAGG